jgi:RNAse (barnase) inhibitor barstar
MDKLINVEMNGKPIAARRGSRFGGHEFCVMVMDCGAMKSHLIPISRQKNLPESHHRFINKFSGNSELVEDLDPRWNCLDGEDRPLYDIWQLHFTKMSSQPWKPDWFTGEHEKHSRQDIVEEFYRVFEEAKQNGFNPDVRREELSNSNVVYNIIGR